jgi:glycosyltransferase involved in cell wall biosynthesis
LWFRLLHPRHMTAITPSVGKNLLETTGQPVIRSIGNPAPFPEAPPSINVERVRSRAVCIARLEPVKGHAILLDAWKILADRGHRYELHLVGEGSLRASLEKQIQTNDLQNLVYLRGYSPDVTVVIDECLFAILPSRIEGQGIVTIEAASRGRASLLTAVPGSVDVLPPSGKLTNGIEYGNAVALARALEQWFASPQEVVTEGVRFFDFLKPMSDASTIARQYEAVYQDICESSFRMTNRVPIS